MTSEEVIEAASAFLEGGGYHHLSFDTPERVSSDSEEFWRRFALATGKEVEEGKKSTSGPWQPTTERPWSPPPS